MLVRSKPRDKKEKSSLNQLRVWPEEGFCAGFSPTRQLAKHLHTNICALHAADPVVPDQIGTINLVMNATPLVIGGLLTVLGADADARRRRNPDEYVTRLLNARTLTH